MISEFFSLDPATQAAWVAAMATVVIAAATIASIWIYRRMSRQVREQIAIASRQADQIERQIEIARQEGELTRREFESTNRSYVFLELIDTKPESLPTYSTRLMVTNFGNVPSESLVLDVELKCGSLGIGRVSPEGIGPITVVPRS